MKAENGIYKAVVIATGVEIEVYRLKSGKWCDYSDCKTEYSDNELRFI